MDADVTIKVCADSSYNDAITKLFVDLNYNLTHRHWVQWKYEENPDGSPFFVLAFDQRDNIVGMQAHLPRVFSNGDSEIPTVQAIDALVDPAMRRRGIYQRLWYWARKAIRERGLILTAFAPITGMSIGALRNENLCLLGYMETLYCPIRPSVSLTDRKYLAFLAPLARCTLDLSPRLVQAIRKTRVAVQPIVAFTETEDIALREIRGRRDKEYLNWRYIYNPIDHIQVLQFQAESGHIGFAALRFHQNGRVVEIIDFIAREDQQQCIIALQSYIYNNYEKIGVLFFKTLEHSPFIPSFRRCGFFLGTRDIAVFVDNIDSTGLPPDPKRWLLNLADSDW